MLDDKNLIKNRDPQDALGVAENEYMQDEFPAEVQGEFEGSTKIEKIVVAGMGGSALSALLAKAWLAKELKVPFEVWRNYDLPRYVDANTLLIASSYSGNTEETVSALELFAERGPVAVIASGGKLVDIAKDKNIPYVQLPSKIQPRMAVIDNLRALLAILAENGLISKDRFAEIAEMSEWLKSETKNWASEVPETENYAKQLAMQAVGKTPVFYGGPITGPLAYKWKISWNENAKNVAFWNEYPEFNHNEFMGWTSHPVEKPFAVFDLISPHEHPQILKRFQVSDRLLSGKRPKAKVINLEGNSVIKQLLWGSVLADFVSIYVAILNNVNPTPVDLIEKLKSELA